MKTLERGHRVVSSKVFSPKIILPKVNLILVEDGGRKRERERDSETERETEREIALVSSYRTQTHDGQFAQSSLGTP